MRMIAIITGAALGMALAACNDESAEPAGNVTVPGPEATENQLEAMPEGQRNAVFIRAIQDAGQECRHVDSSARAGEHQGFPVWTARCAGGGEWTIVITNDGNAAVLNAAEAQLVGGNQAQNAQGE